MIKSLQTSGGTVLSTDWNDVKNKDYEGRDKVSPPKGQEWKKYGWFVTEYSNTPNHIFIVSLI